MRMAESHCEQFRDPKTLVACCQMPGEDNREKVCYCLFRLFFIEFKKAARMHTVSSPLSTVDEQLQTAFNDGSLKFYNQLKDSGWEEKGVEVKFALFRFCGIQLLRVTTDLLRKKKRNTSVDPDGLLQKSVPLSGLVSVSPLSALEDKQMREQRQKIFEKAFDQLEDHEQDFIRWRKLHLLTKAQMKQRYPKVDWEGREPNDIVFRSATKLQRLVARLTH